jgi:hypothetical protein
MSRPPAHELEEFAIFRACTRAFLCDLRNSDYVSHYNSNNLFNLMSELERERFYPERVFTVAHYTSLCTCVRECLRMGARECTEAFPTWQYSLGAFRARIVHAGILFVINKHIEYYNYFVIHTHTHTHTHKLHAHTHTYNI